MLAPVKQAGIWMPCPCKSFREPDPYIAGFVIPVPAGKMEAYRKWAENGAAIFKEYGCIEIVECWEDNVPTGKYTDFRRAVGSLSRFYDLPVPRVDWYEYHDWRKTPGRTYEDGKGTPDNSCLTPAEIQTVRAIYASPANPKSKREIAGLAVGS